MCDAMTALAAVASIAGQQMSASAQEDAADRQQAAINASLEQQDQYSRQAESKALENADQYDAKNRLVKYEEAQTKAGDSLAQQLVQSREAAPTTSQPAGRLSQAFLTGDASAKADQLEKSIGMARLMGKMRGSSDMLTDEGYQNADYASQLGIIGRNAQGSARAAQPGINAAGQVDSGASLVGGLLSGVGGSALSSSLGQNMGKIVEGINPNWMKAGTSNIGPTRGIF